MVELKKIALGHNQYTSKHLLTVMKEGFETPDPKYINHEVCGKSGLEMASNVVSVLKSTKSLKTLVAGGCDSTASKYELITCFHEFCNH